MEIQLTNTRGAHTRSLWPLVRLFTPTEIIPGQIWGWRSDHGNPWAEWVARIEDVQGKWVKYKVGTPHDGYWERGFQTETKFNFRLFRRILPNVQVSHEAAGRSNSQPK